jgi:protease I
MCPGVQVPAALGFLQGRRTSAFPPLAPDIEAAGGTFVEGPDVVDRNMVSATGWPDLAEWSKAFLGLLAESPRERVAGAVDDGLAVGRQH